MTDARIILFGAGAALVAIVAVALIGKRALSLAGQGLEQVNPLNPNNAIATGANKVGETISGTPGWSLGGWIWELANPGKRAAEERMFYDTAPQNQRGAGAGGSW